MFEVKSEREKFDEMQNKANFLQNKIDKEKPSVMLPQEIYDMGVKMTKEAHQRVKELYGKSEKEAMVLNEEYDRLQQKVSEAMKDVVDFEANKLGMHQESKEEK